jgi:hypothetical protein
MPQATATAAPPEEPPQVLVEVVRIARGAEHAVERLAARTELRRVGLADQDHAFVGESRDDEVIVLRDVVREYRGAERRAHALGRHQVLERDGSPARMPAWPFFGPPPWPP